MTAKYWIKLHHEILRDRKMAQLRDRLFRRAIECFLFAGQLDEDGFLPSLADMAWELHADPEQLETELQELAQAGILQMIDSRWHVTNFIARQAKMTKAEYMRRLRQQRQQDEYYPQDSEQLPDSYQPVTNGHADQIRTEQNREEDDVVALINHFTESLGIWPPGSTTQQYITDWYRPMAAILGYCGNDLEAAIKLVDKTIAYMRRKGLSISRPGSLVNVARTVNNQTDDSVVEALWAHIKKHGSKKKPNGELLDLAQKSGGYLALCQKNKFEYMLAVKEGATT